MTVEGRGFQLGQSIKHERTAARKLDTGDRELNESIGVYSSSRVDISAVNGVNVGSKCHSTRTCVAHKKGCGASVATQCCNP